ncbi:hypothetical protein E4T48_00449 [Aureobasidium sp. EXF-10727]|nr:hypothetical protein E4T48_00449 [Aureobasidium sp. EXF-10727]KAI4729711.1 hypothetical protein E4T49_02502 [Aureobasidium sp. EXF-10728]
MELSADNPIDSANTIVNMSKEELLVREQWGFPYPQLLPQWLVDLHPELDIDEADIDTGVVLDFSRPEEMNEVSVPDPSRIRKASDPIQRTDTLVVLNDFEPGTPQDQQTSRCFDTAAELSVVFKDGTSVGPIPDKQEKFGLLTFYVELLGLAPTLVLEFVTTPDANHNNEARSRTEFAFNMVNVVSGNGNKELTGRREIFDFDFFPNDQGATVSFSSEGCRVHDVFCYTEHKSNKRQIIPQARMKSEHRLILETFARIAKLASGDSCTINIKLTEGLQAQDDKRKKKLTKLQQLADMLPSKTYDRTIPQFTGRAYPTYRTKQGELALQHNQQMSRMQALRAPHPGASIPSRKLFRDNDEAALFLAVGQDLLQKESNMYMQTVSVNKHAGVLFRAGNFATASIKYSKPLASGIPELEDEENIRIPDGTAIKLHMTAGTNDKQEWIAIGHVSADVYGFGSDLFVMITDQDNSALDAIITENGADKPKFLSVQVEPIINDITTRLSIDAIMSALGKANKHDNPKYVPAMFTWPILYQGENLKPKDVFATASGRDRAGFDKALKHMLEADPWDSEQKTALMQVPSPCGGMLLIESAAGTGKTLAMARIAEFAISQKKKVLVVGNSNKSLDLVMLKINEVLSESKSGIRPIRAYSARLEDPMVPQVKRTAPDQNVQDKDEINRFAAWAAAEEAFKTKRRGEPLFSVEQKVLENIDPSNPPLKRYYTKGVDRNNKPKKDGPERDMHTELRKFLKLLEQPSHSNILDEDAWSDEMKRHFRYCLKLCRYEVYNKAKIIVCSNVISGTREMAEFAPNDDDEIVLITDEAATIPEALEYIAFNTPWANKITGIYKFGDPRQLGPNPDAATGKNNTVNEFLSQYKVSWFHRLFSEKGLLFEEDKPIIQQANDDVEW